VYRRCITEYRSCVCQSGLIRCTTQLVCTTAATASTSAACVTSPHRNSSQVRLIILDFICRIIASDNPFLLIIGELLPERCRAVDLAITLSVPLPLIITQGVEFLQHFLL